MGYKVKLSTPAAKVLSKLDNANKRRVCRFVDELSGMENPRQVGIAMQGAGKLWRYRVGDYRLIANIEDQVVTITILKIGNRREVYR